MRTEARVVVDTNVLVSALLILDSVPSRCLKQIMRLEALVVSEELLAEYQDVLLRPKFDAYSARENRESLLEGIALKAEFTEVRERFNIATPRMTSFWRRPLRLGPTASCLATGTYSRFRPSERFRF